MVQTMINFQAEQNVEARLGITFENYTLPEADYDEGIEALAELFKKLGENAELVDQELYNVIFEECSTELDYLREQVNFYNNVVRYLDLYDGLTMLKYYVYDFCRYEIAI
jgi:hypothetical protein